MNERNDKPDRLFVRLDDMCGNRVVASTYPFPGADEYVRSAGPDIEDRPIPEIVDWNGIRASGGRLVLADYLPLGDALAKALEVETKRRRRAEILLQAMNANYVRERERAGSHDGFVNVPKDPPRELLISMALRVNHGFGMDDARSQEVQISDMRKVYEEVVGVGFYSEEVKGRYSAIDRAASATPFITKEKAND